MKKGICKLSGALCLSLACFSAAAAQVGGVYQVTQSVGLSGARATGGNYSVEDTGGQALAGGMAQGSPFSLHTGFWTPPDFSPTAATVGVSGRVIRANGQGIRNAVITLIDSTGLVRATATGSFGYYSFEDVPIGGTYVLTITSKRFSFNDPARALEINGELINVDFVAEN